MISVLTEGTEGMEVFTCVCVCVCARARVRAHTSACSRKWWWKRGRDDREIPLEFGNPWGMAENQAPPKHRPQQVSGRRTPGF